jgi:D-alanine-D-alanine ligase
MGYNQNMKSVLILFGGVSLEHEVSIITGLQILENIDKKLYKPSIIYVDKSGKFFLLKNIKTRSDFF